MILVDTGPIVAAASKRDEHHAVCLHALSGLREPALITPLVVMEVCYFLSTRATASAEAAFLRSIAVGTFDLVTLTKDDLERTAQLVERYADLPLGAADASIVAAAERLDVRRVPTRCVDHHRSPRPPSSGLRPPMSYAPSGSIPTTVASGPQSPASVPKIREHVSAGEYDAGREGIQYRPPAAITAST